MVSWPVAMVKELPTPRVRTVDSKPYHRYEPLVEDEVSQILIPDTEQAPETGPQVMATVLEAEPAGELAGAKLTVCRVMPEPSASSEALVDEGEPRDKFTPQAAGLTGTAPPNTQSSIAFCAYVVIPATAVLLV